MIDPFVIQPPFFMSSYVNLHSTSLELCKYQQKRPVPEEERNTQQQLSLLICQFLRRFVKNNQKKNKSSKSLLINNT